MDKIIELSNYYKVYGCNNAISNLAEEMLVNNNIKMIIQARKLSKM